MSENKDLGNSIPTSENISPQSSNLQIDDLIIVCCIPDTNLVTENKGFYNQSFDINSEGKPNSTIENTNIEPKSEKGVISSDLTANYKSTSTLASIKSVRSASTVSALRKKGFRKYIGIVFTLLSGLLYALAALMVKLVGQNGYNTYTISIWRFQGILLPSIALVIFRVCYRKRPDLQSIWPLSDKNKAKTFWVLMLRGIIGCWGTVLQFYSLKYLQVSDSIVVTSSTSVFVTLLAHCFIGEKCAVVPIISALFAIAGILTISRPPILTGEEKFDENILIGLSMAIACMFMGAGMIVIQRYLRNVHFSIISLSSGAWGTVQCCIFAFYLGVFKLPETKLDAIYGAVLAITTLFGQTFLIVALQFEQAGPVAIVQSCDVVFAFMWQFVFLGVVPDYFSLIGTAIIFVGILVTAFRKFLTVLPEEHKLRRYFRFLLY